MPVDLTTIHSPVPFRVHLERFRTFNGETHMTNDKMLGQMTDKPGFIAALDQSGGSTPGALRQYGIPDSAYSGDAQMFKLMHEMRTRIITAPAFSGEKVIGALLFEMTMDRQVQGKPVPSFVWEERGVVPFLKIDKGLLEEADGVRLMKPILGLDGLLERAVELGIFGTKMRSVIGQASAPGIARVVKQQFEYGTQVQAHGLVPILELEVLIKTPDKAGAEKILLAELLKGLEASPDTSRVMLKLTLPEIPDFYRTLVEHPRVVRVVALSGGYSLEEACERLRASHGVIASFSRALINDLKQSMSDTTFNTTLAHAAHRIYQASVVKD
jgi:fructose-bisphosphate aldolase, class I